jgi:hypothetical protein
MKLPSLCIAALLAFLSTSAPCQSDRTESSTTGKIAPEVFDATRYFWDKGHLVGYNDSSGNNSLAAQLWDKDGRVEMAAYVGKEGAQYLRITGADAIATGGMVIAATFLPKEAPHEGSDYLNDFIVRTDETGHITGTLDVPPHAATFICSSGDSVWIFGGIQENPRSHDRHYTFSQYNFEKGLLFKTEVDGYVLFPYEMISAFRCNDSHVVLLNTYEVMILDTATKKLTRVKAPLPEHSGHIVVGTLATTDSNDTFVQLMDVRYGLCNGPETPRPCPYPPKSKSLWTGLFRLELQPDGTGKWIHVEVPDFLRLVGSQSDELVYESRSAILKKPREHQLLWIDASEAKVVTPETSPSEH